MLKQAMLTLAGRPEVSQAVQTYPAFHHLARRFVAGESLDDAVRVTRELNTRGLKVSLDHLGENVTDRVEAKRATGDYLAVLDRIVDEQLDANISIKLTQIGLDFDRGFCLENLERILRRAREHDAFVRIDMEGSQYTASTLETFWQIWERFKNVGVVIQSYLYRSAGDVRALIEAGARVRLVKGAYNEPPTVAYPDKAEVDASYIRLSEALLRDGSYPAIATHDERMIRHARRFAAAEGIAPERFEFQLLYGIRRDLQARLVRDGHNVRVYVPFGSQWYPYLMRRMAERPANLLFVLRNLVQV